MNPERVVDRFLVASDLEPAKAKIQKVTLEYLIDEETGALHVLVEAGGDSAIVTEKGTVTIGTPSPNKVLSSAALAIGEWFETDAASFNGANAIKVKHALSS